MLLATFICTIFVNLIVAEKSTLSRTYEHLETQTYVDRRELSNAKLVYAHCNSSLPKFGKKCIVTTIVDAYEEKVGETKECAVNLKPELPNGQMSENGIVYAFGNNKVLLAWIETEIGPDLENENRKTILKTYVIHMHDNCRVIETKVKEEAPQHAKKYFNRRNINILVFNDVYKIRIGYAKDSCDWVSECDRDYRFYTFDDQGRQVGKTENSPMPASNGPPSLYQSEDEYFVTIKNSSSLFLKPLGYKANDNEDIELLKHLGNCTLSEYRLSLINEAMGLCYLCEDSSFGCMGSVQKTQTRIQAKFSLDGNHKTHLTAVYNLRNGGILLAAEKCVDPSCSSNEYTKTNEKYNFIKIDTKSKVQPLEVHFETKCTFADNNAYTKIFENKKGQYCLVRLCENKPFVSQYLKKGRLETSVQCFPSDKFTK